MMDGYHPGGLTHNMARRSMDTGVRRSKASEVKREKKEEKKKGNRRTGWLDMVRQRLCAVKKEWTNKPQHKVNM